MTSESHLFTLFYYHAFQSNLHLWSCFVNKWSSVLCQENSKTSISDWRWYILNIIFLCSPLDPTFSLTLNILHIFAVSSYLPLIPHSPASQLKLLLTKWPLNYENKTDGCPWVLAWPLVLTYWSLFLLAGSLVLPWFPWEHVLLAFLLSLQLCLLRLTSCYLFISPACLRTSVLPTPPPSGGSSFFPVVSDKFSKRKGSIPSVWQSRHSTIIERMSDLTSVTEF